jgi:hypothetical protein
MQDGYTRPFGRPTCFVLSLVFAFAAFVVVWSDWSRTWHWKDVVLLCVVVASAISFMRYALFRKWP